MKLITLLILSSLLMACTPPTKLNMAKGEFLCKDNGGLYHMLPLSEYPIMCRDGTKYGVKSLETTIISDHNYLPKGEYK